MLPAQFRQEVWLIITNFWQEISEKLEKILVNLESKILLNFDRTSNILAINWIIFK